MSAKSSTFSNDLLNLVFNGAAVAGLADNASASPLASLYVSLHTATPDFGGDQTTDESSYPGYARAAVARDPSGWTVLENTVSPTSTVTFPAATGAGTTVSFFAVGVALTGTGKVLYFGKFSPAMSITAGTIPQLSTSSTISEA